MNKRASIVPSYGNNKGPITRAKAATLASHGRRPLSRPPLIPDKKQTKVGRTKRVTSEENNHTASYVESSQNKKRAVLRDVSNVCCETSSKNYVNAVKIQAKACTQQVRPENVKAKTRSGHKDLKYTPATSSNFELHDDANVRKCKKHVSENLFDRESSFTTANLDGTMLRETKMGRCLMDVKGILSADQDSSNCLGIQDIDLDISNPEMCSLYAKDIYNNLRASELIRRTSSTYMETLQREITQSMRGILIDWLVEVAEEYRLVPDTLYLSVYAIDSFLSENCIERQRLQLLGVTCMLIASKYEEICAPRVEEFCYITDNTYNKADVLKMEIEVLSYLDFRLSVPTIKTFLRRFVRAAQTSYSIVAHSSLSMVFVMQQVKLVSDILVTARQLWEMRGSHSASDASHDIFIAKALSSRISYLKVSNNKVPSLPLGYMANYLSELTLVEYSFIKFLPSVIAASAVFLARWTLDQPDQPWNCTLEHYTSYKALDLKPAVLQMHYLQQNSSNSPLSAVRDKYIQEKYERVACRVCPKLPDSLFF